MEIILLPPLPEIYSRLAELIRSDGQAGMSGPLGEYVGGLCPEVIDDSDLPDGWGFGYMFDDASGDEVRLHVSQIYRSALEADAEGLQISYSLQFMKRTATEEYSFDIDTRVAIDADQWVPING